MNRVNPCIAIFGAGSIGCYLGGCLQAAGNNVVMVGRERIKNDLAEFGLTVTDYKSRNQTVSADALEFVTSAKAIEHADFILLTVKSGDTSSVALELNQHAKPDAIIISFQNGVHNGDILRQQVRNRIILTGMVPFNVANQGQGKFHCGTEGDLSLENGNGAASSLINCLKKASLSVISHTDMKPIQWGKLLLNLNNAINALSGQPLLEQLKNVGYRKILVSSIKEALSILQSAGIKPAKVSKVPPALLTKILSLPDWVFHRISGLILKIDDKAVSSMSEDLALNRITEIDYLNGEIVSLATTIKTHAPVNDAIVRLIKHAESQQLGSPNLSPQEILQEVNKDQLVNTANL